MSGTQIDNPYRDWVASFAAMLGSGKRIATPSPAPTAAFRPAEAPKALLFAPHPDDEAIIGALPLRLQRECGYAIVDVAVTLGSDRGRQAGRLEELRQACAALGFGLIVPDGGLEHVNLEAKVHDPAEWDRSVGAVAATLAAERPRLILFPHAQDWNRTHVGTHHLVLEAMRRTPAFDCLVVETEFWGAMAAPNLMVESSVGDVAELVAALALHAGEVARNPYHLRLPAWMIDNVRRGAELVGGQGAAAPEFTFATLYRLRAWADGGWREVLQGGRMLAAGDELAPLFRDSDVRWR